MIQASMTFDEPRARARDPATSHGAAARAKQLQAAHICLILGALKQGPCGKDELGRRAGLSGVACARRLSELHKAKAVRPTGKLVQSDTGRDEREWELA